VLPGLPSPHNRIESKRLTGRQPSHPQLLKSRAWIQGAGPAGLGLIETALATARRTGERREEGYSLISLGAVLSGLGRFGEAWKCLAEASAVERELRIQAQLIEALAGLAAAYRAGRDAGDTTGLQAEQAEAGLAEVMAYLEKGKRGESRFVGTVFGLRNYLLCAQVLEEQGDPRAGEVLDQAHALLLKQRLGDFYLLVYHPH
jgi:hypothetical protein